MRWALLFLGGGIGTILRYELAGLVQGHAGARFPWGTFAVNVSGCFLIGVIATLADERALLSAPARLFLTVGILGGFTTFSTFGLESWRLVEAGELAGALANAAGSVAAGMLALVAGVWLARLATT